MARKAAVEGRPGRSRLGPRRGIRRQPAMSRRMPAGTPSGIVRGRTEFEPMRALRYLYRVPLLLWHLLIDLPLVLLVLALGAHRIRLPGGERLDYRLIRAWQSG